VERAPLPETLALPPRGRVLVFAPHADDEVFGCGGTLALHAAQHDPVRVVIAFDGGEDRVARTRRAEALRGGARLGLEDYVFWNEPSGHEASESELESGARLVSEEIAAFRPCTVYAPWVGEQHVDHHALGRAVELALARGVGARIPIEAWSYEVWTPLVPERVVDVSAVGRTKARALAEHASQLAETPLVRAALGLAAQRALYLPKGARYGEAFRRIRPAARASTAA
jgi:LmbE family N-acetylglucosaminyl deacetylase